MSSAIEIQNSVLLIIDVQGKLANMMCDADYQSHIRRLIKVAGILEFPILLTEQAPDKIGRTVVEITDMLKGVVPISKQTFSCCGEPAFVDALKHLGRRHVVVCGIESHVCVYQTVRDLLKTGHQVSVVAEAVSARSKHNAHAGIARCKDMGAVLTTLEMLVTELIVSTRHPKFREIMSLLKNA